MLNKSFLMILMWLASGCIEAPITEIQTQIFGGDILLSVKVAGQTRTLSAAGSSSGTWVVIPNIPVGAEYEIAASEEGQHCVVVGGTGLALENGGRQAKVICIASLFDGDKQEGMPSLVSQFQTLEFPDVSSMETQFSEWAETGLIEFAESSQVFAELFQAIPLEVGELLLPYLLTQGIVESLLAGAVTVTAIVESLIAAAVALAPYIGAAVLILVAVAVVLYEVKVLLQVYQQLAEALYAPVQALWEYLLEKLGLKEELEIAECLYYSYGGPKYSHPLEGTNADFEFTWPELSSIVDWQGWLDDVGIDEAEAAADWAGEAYDVLAEHSDEISSVKGAGEVVYVCGRITYEPQVLNSGMYAHYEQDWRQTDDPHLLQPARRLSVKVQLSSPIGDLLLDGHTNDRGYYRFAVPNQQTYTLETIQLSSFLTQENYHADGIGPSACTGTTWDVLFAFDRSVDHISGYSSHQESRNHQYGPAHAIKFHQGVFLPVELGREANIHIQPLEVDFVPGLADIDGNPGQSFALVLSLMDIKLMETELFCEAVPDYQFRAERFVISSRWIDGEKFFFTDERDTMWIEKRALSDAAIALHELLHLSQFNVFFRDDSRDVAVLANTLADPRDAFAEAWMRANQVWMMFDGTAWRPESGRDLYSEYERGSDPSVYSMESIAKAFLELAQTVPYSYLFQARFLMGESPAFLTMFNYLAMLYQLVPQYRSAIATVAAQYLSIESGDAFVCRQDDSLCLELNQTVCGGGCDETVDAFDTQNYVGRGLRNDVDDQIHMSMYDLNELCPRVEPHMASAYNVIDPPERLSYLRTSAESRRSNRLYACPIARLSDRATGAGLIRVQDTDFGCEQDPRTMRLQSFVTGRHFEPAEAVWGEYGRTGVGSGTCPEVEYFGELPQVALLDVRFASDWMDCFSFQKQGCAHLRD